MSSKTFIGLALLTLTSAQNTVTSLFIPGADPQPLAASIIGNDANAVTYSINCPPGTDSSDCGMGPGITLIEGPKTVAWTMAEPEADFYGGIFCSLGGTTTAICTTSMSGTGANDPGVSTEALSDITFLPVTITAGSITSVSANPTATTDSSSGATTSASTGSGTSSGATAANTSSETSASGVKASSTSVNASGASGSSSRSTGGMPQITGNTKLAIGGAAMAMAAAVL